jgi:hypothetical protein
MSVETTGKSAAAASSSSSTQQLSLADIKGRIGDLETIAEWRDDLDSRLRRAELRFELVGLDAEEQELLHAEVETFKLVSELLGEARICTE